MTPEEKDLLTKTAKFAEENNKILRGIRRSSRFSFFFRVFYWIIILGSLLASYYAIQPYINPVKKAVSDLQNNLDTVKNATNRLINNW